MKYPSFLDFKLYEVHFHDVVIIRPKIDFLFKSASTYCTVWRRTTTMQIRRQQVANQHSHHLEISYYVNFLGLNRFQVK